MTDDPIAWPVELRGVTETLVTTLGPNDLWNVAPLGVHAPAASGLSEAAASASRPAARTWGRTRTWRNFRERGGGYVQFTRDPELFVEAALSITERDEPVLAEADAWVRVGAPRELPVRPTGPTGGSKPSKPRSNTSTSRRSTAATPP